jgi:hypothetical protein
MWLCWDKRIRSVIAGRKVTIFSVLGEDLKGLRVCSQLQRLLFLCALDDHKRATTPRDGALGPLELWTVKKSLASAGFLTGSFRGSSGRRRPLHGTTLEKIVWFFGRSLICEGPENCAKARFDSGTG